ncbi:hypothetical protein H696_03365 [Fonticula alba]|uniref:GTP:AMP phosphotransferase, mitochondrial n=1 Tax=Fonticula alba TaxID=691883 RepID=A0A058Z7J7_FONAL|nr:hypothetical protein H696_03365 [Fonticula alba]KCV69898.1 hypothetical protein H696_03365 [Fonticula alba]|eukprot:XP_009495504.1 hypothetical protein H696_03365 [Fonticula alba]
MLPSSILGRKAPALFRTLGQQPIRAFSCAAGDASASNRRLLIFGAPGSGKGTLAGWLGRDLNAPTQADVEPCTASAPGLTALSSGDLLRAEMRAGTPLGQSVEALINSGGLVPDDDMVKLIAGQLAAMDGSNWLLDGFPRTLGQAMALDEVLTSLTPSRQAPIDYVIHIDVPSEVIVERIAGRLIHPGSGRIYNRTFSPPKVPGVDDLTGEPLVSRVDDDPESVRRRLELYAQTSQPILDYYMDRGIVGRFTGPTSDAIYTTLLPQIQEILAPTVVLPSAEDLTCAATAHQVSA